MGMGCRRRVAELERAHALILSLTQRLAYTMAPPVQLMKELLEDTDFHGCDYLSGALDGLTRGETLASAWTDALQSSALCLMPQDKLLLKQAGGILGASDLETQQQRLALLTRQLEARIQKARERSPTDAKLAATLGSLLGLALAVLFL